MLKLKKPADRHIAILSYGLAWLFGGVALAEDEVIWVVPMLAAAFAFALYAPRPEKGGSL